MPMPSYTAGRLRLFEQRVCDGNRSMRFSCLGSIEGCPTLGGMTLAVTGSTGFVALAQRAVIGISGSSHCPGSGASMGLGPC